MASRYDGKSWIFAAIKSEQHCSPDQLWKGEPSATDAKMVRFKRIKFLRKHGKTNHDAISLADRLDSCCRRHRCLSGACPECGRLFQRAWVRESEWIIASMQKCGTELVAISLVPPNSVIPPDDLHEFDIDNFRRRLKGTLKGAEINCAIGGVDFSFNEDKEGIYPSFWCPHAYVITSKVSRTNLAAKLNGCRPTLEIPRPRRITCFDNTARRRSYTMKMHFQRRIGHDDDRKSENGRIRRNTSRDRLRSTELLELFLFLDQVGFSARAIFMGIKPIVRTGKKRRSVEFIRMTISGRNTENEFWEA